MAKSSASGTDWAGCMFGGKEIDGDPSSNNVVGKECRNCINYCFLSCS